MSLAKYFYNGKKCAACGLVGDWALKNKLTVAKNKALYGDIVLFDFNNNGGSDHIGFIVSRNKNGSFTCLEGNTSKTSNNNGGEVMLRTRYANQINYIIRWTDIPELRAQVMTEAKKHVGVKESPRNSNKQPFGKWYGWDGVPWCAIFVTYCFWHAGEKETVPTYPTETLKKGSYGVQVKALQNCLNKTIKSGLAVDGDFGDKTDRAVRNYQKKSGLVVDGIVGYKTRAKIRAELTASKPAAKTSEYAIDVSYWQGKINWREVKAAGIKKVIIRSGYTTQDSFTLKKDSTFAANIKGAIAAGLKVGVYHYSQAITTSEAKREADFILDIIKPYKNSITLPVVFDWEFGKRLNSSVAKRNGKATNTAITKAFCDKVRAAGYVPMVYANYSTFSGYLNYTDIRQFAKIWLAQYSSKPSYKSADWWQYSSDGRVKGIAGRVDCNIIYK